MDALKAEYSELMNSTLPSAARSKSSSQEKWPVHLNHCFLRIILDSVVGQGTAPWKEKIPDQKKAAIHQLTQEQLRECIELGHAILDGKANLVELDERSLKCRGKASKIKAEK
ncbi:methylated dna-protein cysteine c-terminal [Ceraceosorus bombacis]|uniref:Methylated dna-protein cysteine c-terminal n=1 Tax=Ceraceosorus bombacis TaxID=401625 RepID=A0A0P1BDZ3_9BASI|nr:methylated dna-protein cysteine c-terminal [Ceraceosorus bombacis]